MASLRGGSTRSNSSNSNSSSSNSSSNNGGNISHGSSTCTRVTPGPVISVSPSHTLEYDCTDCGSFLFAHRGRTRPRQLSSNRHSHYHSRASSLSEPGTQAHAQRLLLVANSSPLHTPFTPVVSHSMILPQHEQVSTAAAELEDHPGSYMNAAATTAGQQQHLAVSNDVSEPVSGQASDDEVEVVANERVMDFVACHGASPATGAGHAHDSSSTLSEIFRCFICLGKVVDAQLCPCCSKLVCQPCINRWLTDQKSECPHCRAPLLVSQLVSCRFISEISMEVEKIQGKLGDSPMEKYCPTHDSPLLYFCTTCAVAVCSDCAVLIEDHRNHTFEKLSVAYGRHKKKIRIEAAGLRKRRKELSALVASVDKNIETVLKSKDEAALEIQMAFKRMQSRLEEQLKCKLLALLAQKGSMTQEMELLDTILHELDQQLNSIPKSDLIAQEPNMSRMLQDIRTRTFSDISRTPIPPEFTSEVVPSYEHGELILKNYKETLSQTRTTVIIPAGGNANTSEEVLLMSKDVVYSESICASGVTWRLKVYPNGSGASEGTHLSVFLEMVEGRTEAATYEYGIELQHRARPNQRIVRKFSSDFEEGACWGYYQFFRIDLLEKEGYLQPEEDTVALKFYVRPLTYQQQCQDLRRSLAALQAERDESATQVAVIRRAFAATFFQRRRRRSSRGGHVTSEQLAFTQAVAAGAGIDVACSSPSPTVLDGVRNITETTTTTESSIPSMQQLQLKMQEYQCSSTSSSRAEKWQPGSCTFGASGEIVGEEISPTADPFGESFGACSLAVDDAEDEDTEEAAEELMDMRRNNRNHQEIFKGGEQSLQTPKVHARVHKKLRSRKMHRLTLLAPEGVHDQSTGSAGTVTGITAGLVQHFEGLSMVEAGTSSTVKKAVHSASRTGDESKECGTHSSLREKNEDGCSDAENGTEPNVVDGIKPVAGTDENRKHPYSSSAMSSSNNFCTPEIEDWGNVKNDPISL